MIFYFFLLRNLKGHEWEHKASSLFNACDARFIAWLWNAVTFFVHDWREAFYSLDLAVSEYFLKNSFSLFSLSVCNPDGTHYLNVMALYVVIATG